MTSGDLTVGEFRGLLLGCRRELAARRFLEIASRPARWACRRVRLGPDLEDEIVGEVTDRVFGSRARAFRIADAGASLEGGLRSVVEHLVKRRLRARSRRRAA
jgi:hypothetical protein